MSGDLHLGALTACPNAFDLGETLCHQLQLYGWETTNSPRSGNTVTVVTARRNPNAIFHILVRNVTDDEQ